MKIIFITAALALIATWAFAGGIDLSVNACPDNAGATPFATTDCSGATPLAILGTWEPNEAIPDLSNLDGTLQYAVAGDLDTSSFWNFDGLNDCARGGLGAGGPLRSSQARPASGCESPAYTDTWGVTGSGTAIGGAQSTPRTGKIAFTCYRPSPLGVAAGQRLFGMQIVIDTSEATEAGQGGTCTGCTEGACIVWLEGRPEGFGSSTPTNIQGPTGSGAGQGITTGVIINAGLVGLCAVVPVRRRTWGSLKSLYR